MAKSTKVKEEEQEVKKSELEKTMDRLNKLYGAGSIMKLGTKDTGNYDVISTGSIGIDWLVLGIGGVARGKMYELMGWEGTGKSTVCINLMANCQKQGGKVLCIDSEHAIDTNYCRSLGVDVDNLILNQCSYGEEGFTVAEEMIKSGEIALCIIDSDSGLIPKKVMQGAVEETSKIGVKASLNSTMYPKLKVAASQHHCAVVVVSQYREKIGQMYGDPTTTQGGHCLKFTADVRMQISKTLIKTADGQEKPGNETKANTIKNKMYPPYREWKFDILFGEGVDSFKEVLTIAEEIGVITRNGAFYYYGEAKLGQGWDNVIMFMKDNQEMYEEIREKTIIKMNPVPEVVDETPITNKEK